MKLIALPLILCLADFLGKCSMFPCFHLLMQADVFCVLVISFAIPAAAHHEMLLPMISGFDWPWSLLKIVPYVIWLSKSDRCGCSNSILLARM